MRHYLDRNYSFYGIAIIIGLCVIVGIVLWLRLGSKEPGKDVESVLENTIESLPSPAITDELSSLKATPVLTITEMPLSPVKEVITPTVTAPIYILAEESETTIEVWQFLPDDGRWSRLYSITRAVDKPDDVIIPPQEIERMQNYLETNSLPIGVPDGSLFKRHPRYLALSPTTHKLLAFVEWYFFNADDTPQGRFGIEHTGIITLETEQSQIFFQIPDQVLVDGGYYEAELRMPLWSPNAQYYSVRYNVINHNATPLIINVNTGSIQQLESAANLFGPLAWSPDSTTVFLYLYRSGFDSSGGIIRLCDVESLNCQDIELDGVWIDPRGADWTPHRNQIVFAGANEDFRWSPSPPPFALYLFDPETKAVHELLDNFNRSLANPLWSPDGQLIAAEYNTEGVVASPNTIVIVDPDVGQAITEIPIQGCAWQWEQSSQSIMQLPCGRSENHSLVVFSIFDTSSQQIELPVELSWKRRLGFNTLKLP